MVRPARLILQIGSAELDDEEIDRATRRLLDEVRESNVESAGLIVGETEPGGAKAAGVESLGMIAVQLLPAAIPALLGMVRDWSRRNRGRSVKVKAQFGDRVLELEYPADSMSEEQFSQFVATVTNAVREPGEGTGTE